MDRALDTVVTILKPTVDIVLQNQEFSSQEFQGFARNQTFDVTVRARTQGQKVSAVDALLNFDPEALQVVGPILPGDGRLEQVIVSRVDAARGTIEFSAVTQGTPVTQDFDVAVVKFQALQATRALSVGFRKDHPTDSDAAYQGVSVLRDLVGFPVELALELKLTSFDLPNLDAEVVIRARPNGSRVSAVDAFLDVDPTDIGLESIAHGRRLEQVLTGDLDRAAGHVGIGAATFNPTVGEFDLATVKAVITAASLDALAPMQVLFHCYDATGNPIPGCALFPRSTEVALNGESVLDVLTPLATLRLQPPGAVENLIQRSPDNQARPTFDWDPPRVRPAAGIRTFNIAITGSGDDPGPTVVAGDFAEVGTVQCFDANELELPSCFDASGSLDIDNVAFFRMALKTALGDGRYTISVSPVDNLGQQGELKGSKLFSIDTQPPTVPVTTGPLGADLAFTRDTTPLLEWDPSTDNLTPTNQIEYDVHLALTKAALDSEADRRETTTGDLFWEVVEYELELNKVYWWRVRGLDKAGRITAALLVATADQRSTLAVERVPGRGNASEFSEPIRFTIDTLSPTPPQELSSTSIGGAITPDRTPTFQWKRSTDPGFVAPGDERNRGSGVDRYTVEIRRTGDGTPAVVVGVVLDGTCSAVTNLCTFDVSGAGVLLEDDQYTVLVQAIDNVGNSGAAAVLALTVDSLGPLPPIVSLVSIGTGENPEAVFRWTRSQDQIPGAPGRAGDESGVDFYNVVVKEVPAGTAVAEATVFDAQCGIFCGFTTPTLTDGDYTVEVNAVDRATNSGDFTDPLGFFAGRGDVPRNLVQLPPLFNDRPTFSWRIPKDPPVAGVGSYQVATGEAGTPPFADAEFRDFKELGAVACADATGDAVDCTTQINNADTIQLTFADAHPDGRRAIQVRFVTIVGQPGDSATLEYDVDTTAPGSPTGLLVRPSGTLTDGTIVVTTDRTPELAWTSPDTGDEVSGLDHYTVTISGDRSGYDQTFEVGGGPDRVRRSQHR